MDLIERYVQEVARRLPRDQRDDVPRELRSSLEDSLESRSGVPLEQASEDAATDLLLEFGSPREVADSYRPGPNYLIGPAHYPSFIKTIKIVIAVIGGLIVLGMLADAAGSTGDIGELARIGARAISDIQTSFLGVLGLVVLIFAAIERTSKPPAAAQDDWHPSKLPPLVDDVDRIDSTGTIVGLVLSTIALVLVNLYPEWLQIRVFSNGDEFSYPLLGSALRTELVLLNIYLALGVLLGVVILSRKRWQLPTRIADAAISAVLLALSLRLWSKADELLPDRDNLVDAGWPAQQAADFSDVAADVLSPTLWWMLLAGSLLAAWFTVRKLAAAIRTAQHGEVGKQRAKAG